MIIDSYGDAFALGFAAGIFKFIKEYAPIIAIIFGVLSAIDIVLLIVKRDSGEDNSKFVKSMIGCIFIFVVFSIFAWA